VDQAVAFEERWRALLQEGRSALRERFLAGLAPGRLLREHARLIDRTLKEIWREAAPSTEAALVATGGYGRGELFPRSDVDLLILLAKEPSGDDQERLERLVGLFWDIGLDAGHSVRTVEGCVEAARADITVQTSLLEARPLAGSKALFRRLDAQMREMLDPAAFFKAKRLEQEQRHAKHQDTPYSLEPNLKEAPGGMRDLQVIRWIARALGIGHHWRDLERKGLVVRNEALKLASDEKVLQDMRIRLHYLAGRREDRVAFDHQNTLAEQCGLRSNAERRAGERLMQRYYRTAKSITQLNTILLQNFETLLATEPPAPPRALNERFQVRGELLEVVDESVFDRDPRSILESFLLMMQHRELRGMTAATLRALWRSRGRLDARVRRDAVAQRLFLAMLQQPRGIVHETRRMNQYDVLGRYLPEFGRIVGQMQHDLFHVYTVDQHILMVLRNARRFAMQEFAHEFPLCSQLMSGFERRWLIYIAALYHDIAKGRGGDHSELGSRDARRFCRRHGLPREDEDLVAFLVEQHLTMSRVAQKQDVYDPAVVQQFADQVGSERRLTALYLLTVADIRGTSPKVWNAWKAKLLEDLYRATRRVIAGEAPLPESAVAEHQAEASRLLRLYALSEKVKDAFWAQLDTTYFLRHDPQEIAWQTRNLYYRLDTPKPVVKARLAPIGEGLQVLIYTQDREGLFARICGYFGRSGFNIVEAKIHTTRNRYALDTFLVMGQGSGVHYRDLITLIEMGLAEELEARPPLAPARPARISRRVRYYPISPVVDIRPDERGAYHVLSIVAADRAGLLYATARVLADHKINLHSARINTLGDRAEDVFLISGEPLADAKAVLRIEQELLGVLQV
jgi:[protein-PII] uridylyltransferase